MDEEIESSSGGSMLSIALALLAIVLGGAGLYFGMNASQQLSPLTDSVDAGTSAAARLEKQLSSIETRLAEIGASSDELTKTVERLRIYGSQNEQAVKKVASAARSNRQEIVNLAEKMKELAGSLPSGESAASATENTSPAASENDPGSDGSGARPALTGAASGSESDNQDGATTYRIQAGDTFAKIAAQLGIRLNALLDANPDVDTRRLQIGQEIRLP
ncbi:MAG: LysM peptidoglycan-binding domain-containing protein [Verrucomicrobia bacterium]|nr:LysM peptidoglycan-binding domain-containing protein [Verrucomicrobiota bacterium]